MSKEKNMTSLVIPKISKCLKKGENIELGYFKLNVNEQ